MGIFERPGGENRGAEETKVDGKRMYGKERRDIISGRDKRKTES